MKLNKTLLFLSFMLSIPLLLQGQENIPLASWRTHFSYHRIFNLAVAGERVYAASENGFFYLDKEDNSLQELSAMQGLSDAGIRELAYHEASGSLLIGYGNANIDIIRDGNVYNVQALSNASLPGERSVYSIMFLGQRAFIGTDYGISIIDLQERELQESFFNLGPEGESTPVYDLAVFNDSLFVASGKGLVANALEGANLANFRSWRHFNAPEVPAGGVVKSLAASTDSLYAGVDGEGLLAYSS